MTESKEPEVPKISRRAFIKNAAIATAGLIVGGITTGCELASGEVIDLTEEDKKTLEEILKKPFVPADEKEKRVLKEMEGMKDYFGQTIESVAKVKYLEKPEIYIVSKIRRNGRSADKDYSIFARPLLSGKFQEVENSVHFPFLGYPIAKAQIKVIPSGQLAGYNVHFLIYRAKDLNPQIKISNMHKNDFLCVCVVNEGNDFKERQIFERVRKE